MLDIKWIISNPDQADKLFAKRGIKPMTKKLIKMSQGRSESITNLEKLLERRNVLSKKIPNIKDKIEKNNLINNEYVSYGNHTYNHYVLSSLTEEEQYYEIFNNMKLLKS